MPRSFAAKLARTTARAQARAACERALSTSSSSSSSSSLHVARSVPLRTQFRQTLATRFATFASVCSLAQPVARTSLFSSSPSLSASRFMSSSSSSSTSSHTADVDDEPLITSTGIWKNTPPPSWITPEGATPSWITNGALKDAKSSKYEKYGRLGPEQRIVMLGFGAIGTGVLPLLHRHIEMAPNQLRILSDQFNQRQRDHAADYQAQLFTEKITKKSDLKAILSPHLRSGDILINVSVDVSSVALIEYCQKVGCLYIDTCNEPWAGGYSDPNATASERSNYAFREEALEFRDQMRAQAKSQPLPTAVITHGANPGMVSHFVKQACFNIARDNAADPSKIAKPTTREGWARLLQTAGVKSIHIAEKDTQASNKPKQLNEFVNTWSIEGFQEEGKQPAELGWGTHEKEFPHDGERHPMGCQAAIFLNRPGALTPVRCWGPRVGNYHGLLITHTEAISIADYFTLGQGKAPQYRPTVHFAYHASNDAMASMSEVAGSEWRRLASERVVTDDIVHGFDDLGVLIMGMPSSPSNASHKRQGSAYWFGSLLGIHETRRLVPNNNATSLQVCSGVLSSLVWAMRNPTRGIVEPEEMDKEDEILSVAQPYLGSIAGVYTNWTPLYRRGLLFPEKVDKQDPWQFANFRVN